MEKRQKRTWAEIDFDAMKHNYQALRALLPEGCKFVGVVKGDAYGHGAVAMAQKLEEWGADYLAVACLDEAIELRQSGIRMPILVMGVTLGEFADELLNYELTQMVGDLELAEAYSRAAKACGVNFIGGFSALVQKA